MHTFTALEQGADAHHDRRAEHCRQVPAPSGEARQVPLDEHIGDHDLARQPTKQACPKGDQHRKTMQHLHDQLAAEHNQRNGEGKPDPDQNQIATAVKRAREIALLPYVGDNREDRDERGRPRRDDRDRDRDRER